MWYSPTSLQTGSCSKAHGCVGLYVVLEKLRVIYSQNHTDGVNYIGISVTEDWCEIRNVLVEYNGDGISFSQGSEKHIIDDSKLISIVYPFPLNESPGYK